MNDMGLFSSLEISAGGLAAERLRMNVIANNIANAGTTRTPEGGPYRRQVVSFRAALDGPQILVPQPVPSPGFTRPPGATELGIERMTALRAGVEVGSVSADPSDFQMMYDPSHPDADEKGYVKLPNVNPVVEMMDLMGASRA